MKRFGLYLCLLITCSLSAFALTDRERQIVLDAKQHWKSAMDEQAQMRTDIATAQASALQAAQSAQAAQASAQTADLRAQEAAKTAKIEHDNLVVATGLVTKMKPVYDQCTSHWGLGAIAYGIGELVKHILIMLIVITVVGVGLFVLSFFFPAIGAVIAVVVRVVKTGLRAFGHALGGLIRLRKAYPPLRVPPSPPVQPPPPPSTPPDAPKNS